MKGNESSGAEAYNEPWPKPGFDQIVRRASENNEVRLHSKTGEQTRTVFTKLSSPQNVPETVYNALY